MKYQHIVFDVDGTLIDTEYAVIKSFKKTLKEYCHRYHYGDEDLKFALGITGRDALLRLGISDIDAVLKVWNENMSELFCETKPFEGIVQCIESLKELGFKIGIVTSKTRKEYISEFEIFEFGHLFDVTICADDTEKHKPNPDPLLKYCELALASKEEVLYVGDSIYDMQCAQSAGIDNALALWGCASAEKPKAKYYLEKPQDILDIVSL